MNPEHMVHMANQIARFFQSYPQEEAVAGIADHFEKFWERRMRRQLFEFVDLGAKDLDPLVVQAVGRLRQQVK